MFRKLRFQMIDDIPGNCPNPRRYGLLDEILGLRFNPMPCRDSSLPVVVQNDTLNLNISQYSLARKQPTTEN